MEMEMDIPLPEELEWLEANSHIHDDYPEDLEPQPQPYPEEEEEEEEETKPQELSKPTLSIPPKPSPIADPPTIPKPQINGKKRFRSESPDLSNSEERPQLEDKRSRSDDSRVENDNDDEDWMRYSPPRSEGIEAAEAVVVEEEKIVSRYASEIDGDCVPVTGLDGDRVYAKLSRVEEKDRLKKLDFKAHSNGLISEPIHILMQKAENEAFTKALHASVEGQSDSILPETPVVNEKLWVDKYAPNSFMELLSDEQTNRSVLLWLKQWDSCVFGSEIRTTTDGVLSALRRHSLVAQHQKLSDRRFSGKSGESRLSKENFKVRNELDQENNDTRGVPELWNKKTKGSGPPERKILLLCGPPGLGKTTLHT